MNGSPRLQPTHLLFKTPDTPYSPIFDDIYFSAQNGIEESKHVYLEGSGFLATLPSPHPITVGEIGFGVGLNFLLTLQAFEQSGHVEKKLTYISVEKHPIFANSLRELYSSFPDLEPVAKQLIDQYPILTPGIHQLKFLNNRVTLLLLLGDVMDVLPKIDAKVQHWYWDGFAPSKNPDAFSEDVFKQVARLSAPGAIGSSFTAAGWVRRSLEALGFQLEKRVGYGNKRECIRATYAGNTSDLKKNVLAPWFSNRNLTLVSPHDHIGIIGAGVAGTALAREWVNRGHSVSLIDARGVAKAASGNSAGIFTAQLSKMPNPMSRFSQAALVHFIQELKQSDLPRRWGVFQNGTEKQIQEEQQALVNSDYPEHFYEIRNDGIFYPECGMLNPQRLCEWRIRECETKGSLRLYQESVARVEKDRNRISLFDRHDQVITTVDHLIYANGAEFVRAENEFQHPLLSAQPLRAIRGQTVLVNATSDSQCLAHTLLRDGYITPLAPEVTGHEHHLLGATYHAKEVAPNQVELDTEFLIHEAQAKWKVFSTLALTDASLPKVGYRLSTPDKLPLIGPVCDIDWLRVNYQRTLKGATHEQDPDLQVAEREWLFMAFGSRGITFSAYGAKLLAALMCGETLPIELDLWEHLHSVRFLIRTLKRTQS